MSNSPVDQNAGHVMLSGDRPIGSPDEDSFNRWPFCQGVARAIASLSEPDSLVVGIYGPWGDGKTSALRMLERSLTPSERIVVVRFNPWLIHGETQLLTGFLAQLAEALGARLKTVAETIGGWIEKAGGILPSIPGVPISGKNIEAAGKLLSETQIEKMRDRVDELLAESGTRVVILIDDIDRLDANEITAIFRIVKLTATFRNAVYVLAFDDEVVAQALNASYGTAEGAGRRFLEKIIQMPLHLPPADRDTLRDFTLRSVSAVLDRLQVNLPEKEQRAFVISFESGLLPRLTTPRQAKLYTNAIAFAIPLLQDEVNVGDLLLFEGLRVFYPQLHAVVRKHPDLVMKQGRTWERDDDMTKRRNSILDPALQGLTSDERQAAIELLERLFPNLQRNVIHGGPEEVRWTNEKRVCSDDYFKRYVTYSVPKEDVADREIELFLSAIDSEPNEATVADSLRRLIAGRSPQLIVRKIRQSENEYSPARARRIALLVSRLGSAFPHDDSWPSFASPAARAAILVAHAVRRVPAGPERDQLAKEVVSVATPVPFAAECLGWMRRSSDDPKTVLIPSGVEKEAGRLLADRIAADAAEMPPYLKYSKQLAGGLLHIWKEYGEPGQVQQFLSSRLESHPEEAVGLLITFVPVAMSLTTGDKTLERFQKTGYESVASIVAPSAVEAALRLTVPGIDRPRQPDESDDDTSIDVRAAQQFIELHRAATQGGDRPEPVPVDA